MRNFQTRMDKIDKTLGQAKPDREDTMMRAFKMMMIDADPKTPRPYKPPDELKITHAEWKQSCQRNLLYEKLHFGQKSMEEQTKVHADWEKWITELGGWLD